MEELDNIFRMLKWKNSPETIAEGKRLAREVKDLSLLIMPAAEPSVWEYCAEILSEKDDAELSPYLDSLFDWISDLNLPGAMTISERLVKFDGEKLKDAFIASYRLTAYDLCGDSETVKNNINKKVSADTQMLNLNYTEVNSADYIVKPGNWLVALVYATDGSDYHWYRRNDDGTWSHKPGSTPVISWDASGHVITDPAICDRGIYDSFLGYYEVGPN